MTRVFHGPDRPAEGSDRWIAAGLFAFVTALFVAEILRNFDPVKLSVPFMVLLLLPMTALHEVGHAAVSAWFGWRICRVVIGMGRPWLRFRYKGTPVEVRLWPIGGHVLPVPVALRRPRLESTLIYAAGPAAELAVAMIVAAVVGVDRLLTLTDSISLIAAQSLVLLVAMDLAMNLVPLPASGEGGAYTDGLGMLLSPFLPDWHFTRAMTVPWVLQSERETSPRARATVLGQGVEALPDNPFMRLRYAEALFDAGDPLAARQERVAALESGELPESMKAKLREQLGLSPRDVSA